MLFRELLDQRDHVYGVFAKTCDPFFIEILGRAGFDFAILDLEHGPNSPRDLYPLLLACEATGMHAIVRVGRLSEIEIQRAMDLGVAGVQIPQIQSVDDAERAVRLSKFHPQGERGVCRFVRAAQFSLQDRTEYFPDQNRRSVIVHIEGTEGVENFDAIVRVPGLDVLFLGPYDLSQSMGMPGEVDHPDLLAELERLAGRCAEEGKHAGVFADTPEAAARFKALGIKYISYQTDVGIFAESCRDLNARLREL